jgi:hypothetical protein
MKESDKNTRRIPVSGIFTGFIFMLVGVFCFVTIYFPYLDSLSFVSKIIIISAVSLILFCLMCFTPSLRDSGFRYYMLVRENRLKAIEEAKKKGKTLKYPGKWQNFIFKTFRAGSVAEECSESLRKLKKGESSYNFLEDCKTVQEAVDKHRKLAAEIAVKIPRLGIMSVYHDSEKFQCLDTGFLLYSVLALLLVAVNLYLDYLKDFDFSITLPPVFSALFFMLHKLCKQKSKDMAHRYLTDVNSGWEEIIEEEKRKKDTVIGVIGSPGATVVNDAQNVNVGNNNKNNVNTGIYFSLIFIILLLLGFIGYLFFTHMAK